MPRREHTSKALRYGTRSQGISHFYLLWPRSSANGMNHSCVFLPSRIWSSFTTPERRKAELARWLHTEVNVPHPKLNPDTVTHPITNRARRRLTSLIETITPDDHDVAVRKWLERHPTSHVERAVRLNGLSRCARFLRWAYAQYVEHVLCSL